MVNFTKIFVGEFNLRAILEVKLMLMVAVELLDTSDKVQLEVKYRLPPAPLSTRTRTKVTQVSHIHIELGR